MRMEEDWLAREMAERMPPELFLRAYGNTDCMVSVAEWLEKEGYELAIYPWGKKELKRRGVVLSVFDPMPKISVSNLHDPLSFTCTP